MAPLTLRWDNAAGAILKSLAEAGLEPARGLPPNGF